MPIKSVKRHRKRYYQSLKGGSSVSSSSTVSSAFTTIKRSLGVKRISDKNCNKEIGKLRQIFSQIKSAYMELEKEHRKQMSQGTKKYRELSTEMKSAKSDSERVSIKSDAYLIRVKTINTLRENMNELFMLFKKLRCVLIKFLFIKMPENLAPVFEEYSTLFSIIKTKIKGMSKTPLDLALIKECFLYYMDNHDKKNMAFISTLRHDILRISTKQLNEYKRGTGSSLISSLNKYCKKDKMDDEIFEGHHIKFHTKFEGDLTKTSRQHLSAVSETVSESETVALGKRKRKRKRTRKRNTKKLV